MHQVLIKKTNTSEPPHKCRKSLYGVKTREVMLPWDESGRCLLTVQVVPGIEVACDLGSHVELREPVTAMYKRKAQAEIP